MEEAKFKLQKTPLPRIVPEIEFHQLCFYELFCIPFPQNEVEEEDMDNSFQQDPQTAGFPSAHLEQSNSIDPEPLVSVNAKDPVQCFEYFRDGRKVLVQNARFNFLPDWKLLRDFLSREGRLELSTAIELVRRARFLLQKQSNVLYLQPPYIRMFNFL